EGSLHVALGDFQDARIHRLRQRELSEQVLESLLADQLDDGHQRFLRLLLRKALEVHLNLISHVVLAHFLGERRQTEGCETEAGRDEAKPSVLSAHQALPPAGVDACASTLVILRLCYIMKIVRESHNANRAVTMPGNSFGELFRLTTAGVSH